MLKSVLAKGTSRTTWYFTGGAALRRAAVAAAVVFTAGWSAASAAAASPALGRWSGHGSGGSVQFVVSRVGGTTVVSDLVVSCSTGAGVDGDDQGPINMQPDALNRSEGAVSANGKIYGADAPAGRQGIELSGWLSGARGTVTTSGSIALLGQKPCASAGFHDVRVSRSGGIVVRDGRYSLSGPDGTQGTFWVYGEGALVEYSASFGTPVGGTEDDPELCESDGETSAFPGGGLGLGLPDAASVIMPSSNGSFSLQNTEDSIGAVDSIDLSGQFGTASGHGEYTANMDYEDDIACAGTGSFSLTLAEPAPSLVPDSVPATASTRRSPQPGRHRKERLVRYVALGDSYASGEGLAPYMPGSATLRDRCHRSTRAYSRLLELPGVRFERDFYACSGATTEDLLSRSRSTEPPQLTRSGLRKAELVTVEVGGDDAGFVNVLAQCSRIVPVPCYRGPVAKRILKRVASLGPTLVKTYEAIRTRTPTGALIAALDYPLIFPQSRAQYCAKLLALFPAAAVSFLDRAENLLDDEIRTAARDSGVEFVDVRHAFADHEVCSRSEWIDFLVKGPVGYGDGSLHPNLAGMQAYARVLERTLGRKL